MTTYIFSKAYADKSFVTYNPHAKLLNGLPTQEPYTYRNKIIIKGIQSYHQGLTTKSTTIATPSGSATSVTKEELAILKVNTDFMARVDKGIYTISEVKNKYEAMDKTIDGTVASGGLKTSGDIAVKEHS